MFGGRTEDDDGDDEWRFSVDEVGEVGEDSEDGDDGDDGSGWGTSAAGDGEREREDRDGDGEGGNVAGALAPELSVESGNPELENVLFVAAGALMTVLAFASLAVPLDVVDVALAVAATAVVAGLGYLVFRRY